MSEDGNARESLDQAAYLAGRLRAQGRWHLWGIALLGVIVFVAILASGMLLEQPAQLSGFMVALVAMMLMVIYTSTRRVIPRHHKILYSVAFPLGALLMALTTTLGPVLFPHVLWWWTAGATASTLPYWAVIVANRVTGDRAG
ncbi:hypothetical protein Skr01_21690 [Sphaerisporangium krabiense]|uniref:Drug/metabolite transporter (DMT)-like permease n=1 Tax=Sphaerisporangium krabiense TaxID=763782 RepID=A0A7W9DRB7_9ACTN|nr:hypothetical protein [Sphaerisporangium krabiense]MBB5627924.1 drug/metabolite transporter (DMT)-like permease [Sphaerisporangium krabiense]GII62084.1 hypothetical protein Skr01_21690 [Sphaerisporangium krabiense]